jgi:spermidine/putrescine transport system permease protein
MSDPLGAAEPLSAGCPPGSYPADTLGGDLGRQPDEPSTCGERFEPGTLGPDRSGGGGQAADSRGGQRIGRAFEVRTLGAAHGFELMLKRRLTERVGGFLSYTLSRSTRSYERRRYVAAFDRTHVANAAAAYDLGKGFRVGGRVVFYTGLPKPPDPTDPGSTRLPAFFRLDVRGEKKFRLGEHAHLSIVAEWLNATLSKEAVTNTVICLAFGYPFAYWIARQPHHYRNILVFLVMIPFWTNFLVRTYAWMLILRDSGLINTFWTITLHDQALMLADNSQFFAWLASITEDKLPLLFNAPAVMLGLFYGYLPFMILPLYASLDKVDWSLLEAAADLGANRVRSIIRVLIPLTAPGIAAGSIIVFIPSLGAYVTPDLMGGAKVSLVGNLLQQQFMTVRDWPFGSAIGFILMAIMLFAIVIYFRVSEEREL